MPPRPPELMEELVEEVLLRVPPDDPARLFRAALACKRWCRHISSPRFSRRYREFHRAPPILGVVYLDGSASRFMPIASSCPPYAADRSHCFPVDARHGRVLLYDRDPHELILTNPITGEERRLPMPPLRHMYCWACSTSILCAAAGCNHLDCSWGPFLVVFVATTMTEALTSASVYSSKTGTWTETSSVEHPDSHVARGPSGLLVGNALYYSFKAGKRILEYDLGKEELAVISLPSACEEKSVALMTAEDGGLGFAYLQQFKLHMWSRDVGLNGWAKRRVIDLTSLLPVCALTNSPNVISFADGAAMILMYSHNSGHFAINLKSGWVIKLNVTATSSLVLPYMSFYTPALEEASTGLRPRPDAMNSQQTHVRACGSK